MFCQYSVAMSPLARLLLALACVALLHSTCAAVYSQLCRSIKIGQWGPGDIPARPIKWPPQRVDAGIVKIEQGTKMRGIDIAVEDVEVCADIGHPPDILYNDNKFSTVFLVPLNTPLMHKGQQTYVMTVVQHYKILSGKQQPG